MHSYLSFLREFIPAKTRFTQAGFSNFKVKTDAPQRRSGIATCRYSRASLGGVGLDLKIRKTRLGKAGFSGNKFPEER